jgi:hypothetical protein
VIVPVPLGGVKATLTAVVLDIDTIPIVGGFGIVVTEDDAPDAIDVLVALVAVTVNVYAVFPVNPDTVIGEVVPVPIKPSGLLVTIYPVIISVPPLGAVKFTLISLELNTVATPIIGAFGAVITEDDAPDDADVPPELVAVTVNVYGVFAVNPDTVIGDDVPIVVLPELLVTV